MGLIGRVSNRGSERRGDKESTACKESKIIRPANNVDIMGETCMAGRVDSERINERNETRK